MCAYVLCQMDYSSPVFPVMDGPLWKVFQVYLGLITLVRLLHQVCLM